MIQPPHFTNPWMVVYLLYIAIPCQVMIIKTWWTQHQHNAKSTWQERHPNA